MSTATAIHQSTIARVRTATIVQILHQDPAFAKLVIFYLVSRIGRIEEDFVDQFFNSSEKRLARILVLLARFDKQSESKSAVLKLSQETLAEIVGTTRAHINRFMNKFRRLGFINYDGVVTVYPSLLSVVLHDSNPLVHPSSPALSRRKKSKM